MKKMKERINDSSVEDMTRMCSFGNDFYFYFNNHVYFHIYSTPFSLLIRIFNIHISSF